MKLYTEAEVLKLIEGLQGQAKYIKHIRDDEAYFLASTKRIKENIERLQKDLERLEHYRAFANELLDENEKKCKEYKRELSLCKHRSQIERLLRMKEKLDEVQSESV